MFKKLVTTVLALAAFTSFAHATSFTSDKTDLLSYTLLGTSGGPESAISYIDPTYVGNGVKFGGFLFDLQAQPAGAFVGKTGSYDLSAYDSFALNIKNVNEKTRSFSIFIQDGNNIAFISPIVSLNTENSNVNPFQQTLKLSFNNAFVTSATGNPFSANVGSGTFLDLTATSSPINLASIDAVGFYVNSRTDDALYELIVAPTPEPGTLLLLGAGLIAAPFIRRRMKK